MKTALCLVLAAAAVGACSQSPSDSTGTGGSGNASAAGGTGLTGGTAGTGGPGTGGAPVTGGTGGAGGSGGSAQAGTTSAGGTAGSSATTGGAPTTGGAGGVGGGTGGIGVGGAAGSVGSTGGVTATGGTAGGGTAGSGAASGAGGAGGSGGATVCMPPTVTLTGNDAVAGELIEFNDNGGWCWYQDERVIVDKAKSKLIVGSVASGGNRNGNIDAVVYDLAAKTKGAVTVLGNLSVDDHNAPAFAIAGNGDVIAMWAGHRIECKTYYSQYSGTSWAAKTTYDWSADGCPWDSDSTHMVTYSNLWNMSAESRMLSGVRSVSTSPNMLTSTDNGKTFSYYGRLSSTPTVGYVAGYYKYWGNGTDRIDFVGTENHPRDFDNNLWHGYIQGGKIYNSTGTAIDETLADKTAVEVTKFTKLFTTGTTINGQKMNHAWNSDLVRYDDGTIGLIWTARAGTTGGSDTPDLRLLYARFDGTTWKLTYLGKAGPKLYSSEQDYTGLGALHPDDPTTIYISSPIDPRDDTTNVGKREIWRGTTCDNGATFTWTPVTSKSTTDNFRPVVPKWDASHTALLWIRGTYTSAQSYASKVVGIISGP